MRRSALLALSLALGACSVFGPGEAEVALMVVLQSEEAQALDFAVAVGERTLARADFVQRQESSRQFDVDPVLVDARTTEIACTVTDGDASTTETLRLDLKDGWRYGVTCAVAPEDPIHLCMGCRGSEAFALAPALGLDGDSLYLVWGGDLKDSGIVY